MKKWLYILTFLFFCFNVVSKAQCAYTHTEAGNTTTLNYSWVLIGIYSLDSVRIDFGDGNNLLQVLPVPTTAQHTYTNPGTYNVCLTRYLSIVGNPTPIVCTFCDSVTITPLPTPCWSFPDFTMNNSSTGPLFSFTSTGICYSCVSQTYLWDFGDGGTSNLPNPTHTYTQPGQYNVCLIVTGTSVSNITCTDTICHTVVIQPPCYWHPSFAYSINGQTVDFSSWISSGIGYCSFNSCSWNFGDGSNIVTTSSPNSTLSHFYPFPGTYTVCLTVHGDDLFYGNTFSNDTCIAITILGANLGLNQPTKQALSVYPNPAHDWLYIQLPTNENTQGLRVFDMYGRVIQEVSLNQHHAETYSLKLPSVSAGIYTLKLETDRGIYYAKVHIE